MSTNEIVINSVTFEYEGSEYIAEIVAPNQMCYRIPDWGYSNIIASVEGASNQQENKELVAALHSAFRANFEHMLGTIADVTYNEEYYFD